MKKRPKFDITKTCYADNPCWLFKKVVDPFTPPIARFVYNRGFSANMVTLIAFVLGMSGIAAMVILNNYLGLVIAAVLISLRTLGDAIDGKIARGSGTASPMGSFLDIIVDWLFFHAAFFIAIGYVTGNLWLGFLCVTGYMSREFARTKFTAKYGVKVTETGEAKKISGIVSLLKKYDIAAVTLLAPILLLLSQPVWIIIVVAIMEYGLLLGELVFDFICLGRMPKQANRTKK
jgi:phosphatidylglycerophosphate synthase